MLHRRSLKRFILISLALMGMSVSSANAVSINIDFGSFLGLPPSTYGAAAYGTTLVGESHWNQITAEETKGLVDLKGDPTGVNLLLKSPHLTIGHAGTHGEEDKFLLNDNFHNNGNKDEWSIEILGLDVGRYDIYYYAPQQAIIETGLFAINGVDIPESLAGGDRLEPTLERGVTWDVFNDVCIGLKECIGSLGLLLDFQPPSTVPGDYFGLSGLQLVQTSSAPIDPIPPVPVPAAVWLFGTALIGMIGFGKRRKAA